MFRSYMLIPKMLSRYTTRVSERKKERLIEMGSKRDLTCPSTLTRAFVLVVREKPALPPIDARVVGVAGGVILDLTALAREAQRTLAAGTPRYTIHNALSSI